MSTQQNEIDLKVPGIWNIRITILDKNVNLTILTIRFLILPSENIFELNNSEKQTETWMKLMKQFWKFESLCVENFEDNNSENSFLFNNLFENCRRNSFWSTLYPDPKSNFIANQFVDTKNRII